MFRPPKNLGSLIAAALLTISCTLTSYPAMAPAVAIAIAQPNNPIALGAMSNKEKATAKEVEGKLESAYGELTGDKGHQLKGKAKQAQGSAMHAAEGIKEGAEAVKEKISDAAGQLADGLKQDDKT
jgi:uncharacterized protein YjbJ (UPF0337 family)